MRQSYENKKNFPKIASHSRQTIFFSSCFQMTSYDMEPKISSTFPTLPQGLYLLGDAVWRQKSRDLLEHPEKSEAVDSAIEEKKISRDEQGGGRLFWIPQKIPHFKGTVSRDTTGRQTVHVECDGGQVNYRRNWRFLIPFKFCCLTQKKL